ncbi:hypothetical protein [Glaciimonas sp. PCH181]|uniref:hypothetical protein n=1 Tax=Glaciimonas sp. PCH181 TaxID=2133943 RepID=UPI001374A88E|nr:hypothetical protein [Glaciimonas sp. PCH181]
MPKAYLRINEFIKHAVGAGQVAQFLGQAALARALSRGCVEPLAAPSDGATIF